MPDKPPSTDRFIKRILVCGSRTYGTALMRCVELEDHALYQRDLMRSVLRAHYERDDIIVHGAAAGADTVADEIAFALDWHVERFLAFWGPEGRAAGPRRNQRMLESGITMCLAFIDKPLEESRGTLDMVNRCRAAGIPVVITCVLAGDPGRMA